jgi:nitrite reductase/ring-hydroxylating ferredoxin subunit
MTWHRTECSDIDDGVRAVVVDETPIVLAAVDGSWHAAEDRCSHAGCAFSADGELDGHVLICDCHGAEFDVRTGEVLAMPARTAIRTFPTRVVDGVVEVEL